MIKRQKTRSKLYSALLLYYFREISVQLNPLSMWLPPLPLGALSSLVIVIGATTAKFHTKFAFFNIKINKFLSAGIREDEHVPSKTCGSGQEANSYYLALSCRLADLKVGDTRK